MAFYKFISFVAVMAIVGLKSITQAQVVSPGSCPSDIGVVSNFDVSKYLGTWYEYAKYADYFEGNGVCITAQYTLQDSGCVAVKNSQINGTTDKPEEINGFATVVSNGKLLVKFPVSPNTEVSSNYWVLATDYTTHAVVYSCQPLANNQHSTMVWILTRKPLPSASTIECAVAVLKKNNISVDPLTLTNQVACSY